MGPAALPGDRIRGAGRHGLARPGGARADEPGALDGSGAARGGQRAAFALGARVGDREHLYAGLSAYLLAGIFFGVFYWVLERTWSGSLAIPGEGVQSNVSLPVAIYYSFVTLATLGYGDIVPRSKVARGLAIMEAIAGQLYLAVMIARLVSLYVAGKVRATSVRHRTALIGRRRRPHL